MIGLRWPWVGRWESGSRNQTSKNQSTLYATSGSRPFLFQDKTSPHAAPRPLEVVGTRDSRRTGL